MASPSFFRHRKLTIEKAKKGQNREKKSLNSAPKHRLARFISPLNRCFLCPYLFILPFFCFLKNREKRRKNEKNRGKPRFFSPYLFDTDYLVAEVGFEPHDLRVMSPTSYQAALLRDICRLSDATFRLPFCSPRVVPVTGIEPVRYSRITGF